MRCMLCHGDLPHGDGPEHECPSERESLGPSDATACSAGPITVEIRCFPLDHGETMLDRIEAIQEMLTTLEHSDKPGVIQNSASAIMHLAGDIFLAAKSLPNA